MTQEDINDVIDAICHLKASRGRTIVSEEYARSVASEFDVDLAQKPGELQPIHELDRAQPDNDALGIGVGDLCRAICKRLDLSPEKGRSAGHGSYQDELKEANLPKLKRHVIG